MNGIIHWSRGGSLLLACILASAGCHTVEKVSSHDGCAEGCGPGGNSPIDALKTKMKDYDYEQLHPDHCWPEQYSREAGRRVHEPFGRQLLGGNEIEMTMWEHYFSTEEKKTHELNAAGKRRLMYLTRKKPFPLYDLKLQTSFDTALDAKRIQTIQDYVTKYSVAMDAEDAGKTWSVSIVNREPNGLFGQEAPKSITKMVGPAGGPPAYEPQVKQQFLQTNTD